MPQLVKAAIPKGSFSYGSSGTVHVSDTAGSRDPVSNLSAHTTSQHACSFYVAAEQLTHTFMEFYQPSYPWSLETDSRGSHAFSDHTSLEPLECE